MENEKIFVFLKNAQNEYAGIYEPLIIELLEKLTGDDGSLGAFLASKTIGNYFCKSVAAHTYDRLFRVNKRPAVHSMRIECASNDEASRFKNLITDAKFGRQLELELGIRLSAKRTMNYLEVAFNDL
ncbi:MAG: hypothetical protein V4478_02340 [Patescibacteria group bacterium]